MSKHNRKHLAVAGGILAIIASGGAQAISFSEGAWKMDINGTVNAFYTSTNCTTVDASHASWSFLSACNTLGLGSNDKTVAIQNGFLPGWVNFIATTRANDLDIKAHIGLSPGTSNDAGSAAAAQRLGDVRNVYLSFGDASWGTIKLGRDIGLFEQQATLSDLTVPGTGGGAWNSGGLNTMLGFVGKGYIYTAFQPQITYTSPKAGGFQGAIGVFQPLNIDNYTVHKQPMLQGMATFDFGTPSTFNGRVWGSFVTQKADFAGVLSPNQPSSVTANGYELGIKGGAAGIEGALSGFSGKGVGDGLLFLGGTDGVGQKRKIDGYMGKITFRPITTTKLGVQYGENRNKALSGAKNTAYAFGVYHDLAPGLTLVGEYINEKTKQTGFTDSEAKTFALGAILFF